MTWEEVAAVGLKLPETELSTSYATPALKVKGKMCARLKEDGETMVVFPATLDERELLREAAPEVFYITDHYRPGRAILVRLEALQEADCVQRLRTSWQVQAPPKVRKLLG